MEEVMRFMVLRPPSLAPADAAIRVAVGAELVAALRAAAHKTAPGRELAAVAEHHRGTLGSTQSIPLAVKLAAWGLSVLDASTDDAATALASANAAFGSAATQTVASAEFKKATSALADLVAANKYRGFADADAEIAQRALKAAHLLSLLAQQAAVPSPAAVIRKPSVIDVAAKPRAPSRAQSPKEDPAKHLAALTSAIDAHVSAIAELGNVPARLLSDPQDSGPPNLRGAVLSQTVVHSLSPATRTLMQTRGIQIGTQPLRTAHEELVAAARSLYEQKQTLEAKSHPTTFAVMMGTGVYEVSSGLAQLATGLAHAESVMTALPTTHSTMSAVGYADLMVVRQQLVRYEGADLSHIENVLIGEHKSREHKTSLVTTRTDSSEREITDEEERDLQTTDRNEMQREASSTMKDQLSMQFGAKVSGSYGPTVQFAVNTDLGFAHSKEESHKFASSVAQETVQRTASKITQRVKSTTTITVTNTTEEDNIHEIDNRGRDQHVVGQYQWLDKVYSAQVFNYGNRLLYDFIVPEPAALLLKFAQLPDATSAIKKPPAFVTTADQINEGNYTVLAHKYGATGLEAPPEPSVTVSKVLEGMDDDVERGVTHQTADLPLPEGYAAASVAVATDFWYANVDDDHKAAVVALVSGLVLHFDKDLRQRSTTLSGERGSISIAMHTFRTPSVVMTVTVTCKRTDRALEEWRLKIYTALQQASGAAHREYEDKVARAKSDAADAAEKATPERRTENEIRNELKRLAISMLTHQSFETFDSVIDSDGMVKVAFAAAELADPYIRFFEQAFEWEQMSYVFYPYYWGRTSQWKAKALTADNDPLFLDFLRAGAARLVIPTRLHFEQAVLHFMETGQVWSGGPPPDVTSAEYVDIVTEIKEATGAPGNELPVGDPWEIRLPTQLVRLRTTASLPTWTKNADGSFSPDGG